MNKKYAINITEQYPTQFKKINTMSSNIINNSSNKETLYEKKI